ncbi:MAG: TIGR02680 family protein [Kineosporiaceae bacterium]
MTSTTPAPVVPVRAETERDGGLPTPGRRRWQPLRVGLLELFRYDYQEFWFRDGRLLWRGNNGTGKSKVLALTLPLLLDGDLSPHRVEPDGDPKKKMEWNLLLGGRHSERLGYTWMEFGRRDDDGVEHFLTVGLGLKAVVGRGIADHWFFVTDQRVGADLALVTAAGTVVTKDRLKDALLDRGQVFGTAEQYRRALDERLFRLGADRYAALIKLLIQLRQPQLSKRPDPVLLSRALSEALTPLDPDLLADAAAGFHDLEQQRDEVRALGETRDHVDRFGRRYARYAAVAARRQARELRTAHSAYEEAGRRLAEVREQAEQAETARREADAALEDVEGRRHELEAVRDQLKESPELHDLDRATQDAATARSRAEAAASRSQAAADRHRAAEGRVGELRTRIADADAERGRLLAEITRAAASACSTTAHAHALAFGVMDDVPALRRALSEVADERTAATEQVRGLVDAEAERARLLGAARSRLAALEADRDVAVTAVADAERMVEAAGDALVEAWRAYAAATDSVVVPYPEEVGLPEWVTTLEGPDPLLATLEARVQDVRRQLAAAEANARRRLDDVEAQAADLRRLRSELEAGVLAIPPVPHTRDEDSRHDAAGAPLWRVVDIRDGVGPGEEGAAHLAGIEAALEASGLLDAWITPDARLVDAQRRDVIALPRRSDHRPSGPRLGGLRTLADVLVPAIDPDSPGASSLDHATIAAVLAAVEVRAGAADLLGDESDDHDPDEAQAVVCGDGSFRLGTLRGRWTKLEAEYLGSRAREAARLRRIAELDAALAQAEVEAAQARAALDDVARQEARLAAQLAERPTDQTLRDAHATLSAARAEVLRRAALLPPAQEEVRRARTDADAARTALDETAQALGLPADADGLAQVARALGDYRSLGHRLVAAVERLQERVAEAGTWQAELETAEGAHVEAVEDQVRADDEHRAARARLDTLVQTQGATLDDLRTRLEQAVQGLSALGDQERQLRRAATEAAQRLGVAQGRQAELVDEQAVRQEARDLAVQTLRAFADTGLLAVAAPTIEIPDPAQDWAADPAVRLARRAEAALADTDDSDAAWRRVQDDITVRFTELTESLTRHGHQAHGELREGCFVVSIVWTGRNRTPAELVALLDVELELRERELTGRERQVLEDHLVGDVAGRLQELITEADDVVQGMNAELAERPTSTGMRLRLVWQPDPDGPDGLAQARAHLLRQTSELWSEDDRRVVRDFLQRQIQRMRAQDPQGTWAEHLRVALDYRAWHRFVIERLQDGAWRSATGPASGGERVLTVSLPLFAAASAHYRSAHPDAPRLVLLDEAFAGVDDDARAKCLGLLTQFDLDVAMTSEREWGFYATVPGIATYQLVRHDGVDAVLATAWEWDGTRPRQVDRPVVLPVSTGPGPRQASRSRPSAADDDGPSLF